MDVIAAMASMQTEFESDLFLSMVRIVRCKKYRMGVSEVGVS
jgi:hypothetical protein